jgi:hypothetical protein
LVDEALAAAATAPLAFALGVLVGFLLRRRYKLVKLNDRKEKGDA